MLADLYQELILDHDRHARNRQPLPGADRHGHGVNPLCGDRVTVHVRLAGGTLADVAFEGEGCAISTAPASLMTEALRGKSLAEAAALAGAFRARVAGAGASPPGHPDSGAGASPPGDPDAGAGLDLGKLEALAGVRDYPSRVKCATRPWHALRAALGTGTAAPVTTE
jgi:nitrogen fixation NifU-like protein